MVKTIIEIIAELAIVLESLKPFTSKVTKTRIPAKETTGCSQNALTNDNNKKFDEIKNCGRLSLPQFHYT